MLQNESLLGEKPLREIFKGHGDTRDTHREANPGTNAEPRNDHDQSVMQIWIPKAEAFLENTPNIAELTQPLR
jgi:hypothetical protein